MSKKYWIVLLSLLMIISFGTNVVALNDTSFKQNDIQAIYQSVIEDVEKYPDLQYAGAYLDSSGVLNIGVKNIDQKTVDHIRQFIDNEDKIKFWNANYTLKELDNMMKEITALNCKLNEELGIEKNPITSFGVSETKNCILVTLRNANDAECKLILNAVSKNLPIEFEASGDLQLTARSDKFRPLIGGIQVANSLGNSTGGFGAIKSDGTKMYVVSGHAFDGGTGVYQPTYITTNRIGTIASNPTVGRNSDAASMSLNTAQGVTTAGEIYQYIDVLGSISSSYTPVGYTVNMHGITSGTRSGEIVQKGVTVNHPYYGTLPNQIRADYSCATGDSGGPITDYSDSGQYNILGIQWGKDASYSYYSPIQYVLSDLGLNRVQRYYE